MRGGRAANGRSNRPIWPSGAPAGTDLCCGGLRPGREDVSFRAPPGAAAPFSQDQHDCTLRQRWARLFSTLPSGKADCAGGAVIGTPQSNMGSLSRRRGHWVECPVTGKAGRFPTGPHAATRTRSVSPVNLRQTCGAGFFVNKLCRPASSATPSHAVLRASGHQGSEGAPRNQRHVLVKQIAQRNHINKSTAYVMLWQPVGESNPSSQVENLVS